MSQGVVWFEILGVDAKRSQLFYGELFGWQYTPSGGMPDYGMVLDQGKLPGGVGRAMEKPHVTFYVQVDDVAAALERAVGLGGEVLMPPRALPDGGVIALFADPDGLPVGLSSQA